MSPDRNVVFLDFSRAVIHLTGGLFGRRPGTLLNGRRVACKIGRLLRYDILLFAAATHHHHEMFLTWGHIVVVHERYV